MLGPIFNREALTVPRRGRHYATRTVFLVVFWVLALTLWQAAYGWGHDTTQGDLASFGRILFFFFSVFELTLVLFFSALFAASTIAQEKDRRTFVLLLMTDLRNYEIVLGKLLGSQLQLLTLIVTALPMLAVTMLLGGVSFIQVLLALMILVTSGFAAGAVGCVIALWREKTFQTLALTFLTIVLYLLVVQGMSVLPALFTATLESTQAWTETVTAWQTRLSPLTALLLVIGPPNEETLLSGPPYEFAAIMLAIAVGLVAFGMARLRKWNPSGEPIQQRETETDAEAEVISSKRRDIHAAPGVARAVWPNPILWREIRTRAYGRKPLLIKLAYLLVVGLICFWAYQGLKVGRPHRLVAAEGLVPVTVLSLLLLNAQSVTSITNERDLKALELLLVTDLSPREFVFGKLGGIFFNTGIIVMPPLLMACGYGWMGYVGWESLLYLLIGMLTLMAFTAMLGLHISLRNDNTRLAIGYSLGTVFFLFIGAMVCIGIIIVSGGFGVQWSSFLLFSIVAIGGMLFVLGGDHPSAAIGLASLWCPLAVIYLILSVLIGNPQTGKSGDPLIPFIFLISAFSFTIAAMLVPLLSEFQVKLAYSGPAEE